MEVNTKVLETGLTRLEAIRKWYKKFVVAVEQKESDEESPKNVASDRDFSELLFHIIRS
jgi:hypothetical protein